MWNIRMKRNSSLTSDISSDGNDWCFMFGVIWSVSRSVMQPLFNCIHRSSSAVLSKFSRMGFESTVLKLLGRFTTKSSAIALKLGVLNTSLLDTLNSSNMIVELTFCCKCRGDVNQPHYASRINKQWLSSIWLSYLSWNWSIIWRNRETTKIFYLLLLFLYAKL